MQNNKGEKPKNTEEGHMEDPNSLWEKSELNPIIEDLRSGLTLEQAFSRIEGFEKAFAKMPNKMICSDGRVLTENPEKEIKFGLAGQGLALSALFKEELVVLIQKFLWNFDEITSHHDCGMASAIYKKMLKEGSLPAEIFSAEDLARWFAAKLTQTINNLRELIDPVRAAKEKAVFKHIPESKLTGELHDERAVCFDGTGRFNPAISKDMPRTFLCSGPGSGLSKEYCVFELNTLVGIALSDHGFFNRFTEKNPFYILVTAYTAEDLKKFENWAVEAIKPFEKQVAIKTALVKMPN